MTSNIAPARAPQSSASPTRIAPPSRNASDDEILGITTSSAKKPLNPRQLALDFDAEDASRLASAGARPAPAGRHAVPASASPEVNGDPSASASSATETETETETEPEHLREIINANPELRRAWDDADAYRETIGTPEEARAATALLADLDRMDALFFSRHPGDHAELARAVADLDPQAFQSLAQAMAKQAARAPISSNVIPNPAAKSADGGEEPAFGRNVQQQIPRRPQDGLAPFGSAQDKRDDNARGISVHPTPAQQEFFHSTNAAAVEGVVEAIESQVERLLPEGISKSARSRVVGEIYRELDATLRANRQLSQQMRDAFRSGSLDAEHQRAIVSLVTGRARQALPAVAKRVMNEWTSTLVAANQDRRARQRNAERRVDIAGSSGSGNDGHRTMTPRDLDYKRLSDTDILNM
jgi:hypothetical protein